MEYDRIKYNLTILSLHILGDCVDTFPLYCFSVLTLTYLTN